MFVYICPIPINITSVSSHSKIAIETTISLYTNTAVQNTKLVHFKQLYKCLPVGFLHILSLMYCSLVPRPRLAYQV